MAPGFLRSAIGSLVLHGAAAVAFGAGAARIPVHPPAIATVEIDVLSVPDTPSERLPLPTSVHGNAHAHVHPYPVPRSHAFERHDPSLEHHAPAEPHAASALVTTPEKEAVAPALSPAPAAPVFAIAPIAAIPAIPAIPASVGKASGSSAATSNGTSSGSSSGSSPGIESPPMPASAVSVPATLLASVTAGYPAEARAQEVEADVPLDIVVDRQGRVETARVAKPAGYGFDASALGAIRGYRFSPAQRDGQPVRVRMTWTVRFRLR